MWAEGTFRRDAVEWDALSSWGAYWKLHPSLRLQNGTQFPLGGRSGNGIPVWTLGTGHAFRMASQVETVSRNIASEWDAVSG